MINCTTKILITVYTSKNFNNSDTEIVHNSNTKICNKVKEKWGLHESMKSEWTCCDIDYGINCDNCDKHAMNLNN